MIVLINHLVIFYNIYYAIKKQYAHAFYYFQDNNLWCAAEFLIKLKCAADQNGLRKALLNKKLIYENIENCSFFFRSIMLGKCSSIELCISAINAITRYIIRIKI